MISSENVYEFILYYENRDNGDYFIPWIDIFEWLYDVRIEYSSNVDNGFIADLYSKFLRKSQVGLIEADDEDDAGKDFIMRKTGEITYPWFSLDGFKLLLMRSDSKKSTRVCRFFAKSFDFYGDTYLEFQIMEKQKEINELKKSLSELKQL